MPEPGQPPDLDESGAPVLTQPPDLDDSGRPQPSSFFTKAWHAISDPLTDAPSRFARAVGDYIDQPSNEDDTYWSGVKARAKGFTAGALQGAGDLVSGFTSPLNLATTAATMGSSGALKAGLPTIAKGLSLGSKALAAPVILHGASNVLSPDSTLAERGQGLVEMAGGGAAMMHTPTTKPSVAGAVAEEEHPFGGPTAAGPTKEVPPQPKGTAADQNIIDPYEGYRKVPVGTKYKIAPEQMNRRKMADAIKLGFDINLNDEGKLVMTKVRESPNVNMPEPPELERNALAEAANLPRTLMASMDMSAPLRQGLGLIHKKAFWTSLPEMVKAFGSEDAYKGIQQSILDDPLFKKTVRADGQVMPSFAERAGLKLTDLENMSTREESMMSSLAEKVPGVRASNRAYTAFLNKLRADTFKQMLSDFDVVSNGMGKKNIALAHDIAEFVNTASGRGSLGKLEPSAKALSTVLFSPRLIASRLGLMAKGGTAVFSPETYMVSNPSIRREYLKSLFAIAGAAGTFATLGKMAGASIESDPASSDFGKVKFGNTRIDPYGGFQQYIVAAQRLMPHLDLSSMGLGEIGGKMKSTTTDREYSLDDAGFGRSTRMDILQRFVRSKTNPIINFAWGLLAGQKELSGKPMNFSSVNPMGPKGENLFDNSIAQRFLPMLSQDIYDLVQDETTTPQEKALAAFMASVGMGSQTYGNER